MRYPLAITTLSLVALAALPSPADARWVVEPSMEPVVRQLAVVPEGAPEGTEPDGASLSEDTITVRYQLPDGARAAFVLRHPEAKQAGDVVAGPVAVALPLPAEHALASAFLAACRGLGTTLRWKEVGGGSGAAGDEPPLALARTRLLMEDPDGVAEALDQAVAGTPTVETLREAATLAQAAGLRPRAEALVGKATAALQGAPGASVERVALAALKAGGLPAAEVDAWLAAHSGRAACPLAVVVDVLLLLEQPKAATDLAVRVLGQAPDCREAHRLACDLAGRAQTWEPLLRRAEAAAKVFPEDDGFQVWRATALRGLNRYDEARDLLEAVARKDPHAAGTLSSLANLYTMTRTDEGVYQELSRRCDEDRDDLVTCFLAGVLAHYLAHHAACVARMTELLERLPGQPRVPMYAGISAYYIQRQEVAEGMIQRAVDIAGAVDPDVYYCRSIIRRHKDLPGAIEDLERFLEVAELGWHSQGKVGRVRHELEQLRKGILPPPAEAHHRPEGEAAPTERAAPAPAPAAAAAAPGDADGDPGRETRSRVLFLALAVVGLATGAALWWSRRRRSA